MSPNFFGSNQALFGYYRHNSNGSQSCSRCHTPWKPHVDYLLSQTTQDGSHLVQVVTGSLFDKTTTQEQNLRHAYNDAIVTLIFYYQLRCVKVYDLRGCVEQLGRLQRNG